MKEIHFLVQGSAQEPYKVTFLKEGNNLTALCTCPAGENGLYCKHRFRILDGSAQDIVSSNTGDVKTVQSWLIGTDVENAMRELQTAEQELMQIKKKVSALKKKVARAMRD